MSNDKIVELERYDRRATSLLEKVTCINLGDGAEEVKLPFRKPYIAFESLLNSQISPSSLILELGAGTGSFTGVLLRSGAIVYATDIAPNALRMLSARYQETGRLITQVADMECLPFENEQFDIVTSAGSLSYGDNIMVMNEIFRVLKPGGVFVCVDSLNHNPIYRFNRWIHFLRGERTRSTLIRMPTISLIEQYRTEFGHADVQFFGGFSWAVPLLVTIFCETKASRILDRLDELINVKRSAFKFVLMARKSM